MGGASVLLRHFARMHEGVKLYRQAERALREFKLSDPWYVKPSEKDGRGWGATEAIRGALCHWIGVRPCRWTGSGRGFDRLPGVLILELRRAEIAERGVQ